VWGIMLAVVLVLARIIWGTPLITRVREGFANAKAINASTVCPAGSKMYMYNGVAHCCSGKINTDVDTARETCVAPFPKRGSEPFVFCSLGPTSTGIPNCLEDRTAIVQKHGEGKCPPTYPNYVQSLSGVGKCCGSAGDEMMIDCQDLTQGFCSFTTDKNYFTAPSSCQYLRAQADAPTCPPGYGMIQITGQGGLAGLTLFGCSDNGTVCYAQSVVDELNSLGYDTSSLSVCTATGSQS
jgi:hypothetical protein